MDGGEYDEEAEGGREEDQQAGGDDLGQRTGTHLVGRVIDKVGYTTTTHPVKTGLPAL